MLIFLVGNRQKRGAGFLAAMAALPAVTPLLQQGLAMIPSIFGSKSGEINNFAEKVGPIMSQYKDFFNAQVEHVLGEIKYFDGEITKLNTFAVVAKNKINSLNEQFIPDQKSKFSKFSSQIEQISKKVDYILGNLAKAEEEKLLREKKAEDAILHEILGTLTGQKTVASANPVPFAVPDLNPTTGKISIYSKILAALKDKKIEK